MGFKYEVMVRNEDKWHSNQVVFATEDEAKLAGFNKMATWMLVQDYRIVETDAPANYRWDRLEGLIPLPSEG